MNAWNTITRTSLPKLGRALVVLDALSDELSIPILEYLKQNRSASFLDLTVHTGLESSTLDEQLESLCATKVIRSVTTVYETRYYFNTRRYLRIAMLIKQFN
ncbi:MAG: hypothetical protein MK226_21720 [Saprospiraceae bacterium]|jgi:DNA-binding Lrp family transcriptional regulator|nr:hypothetical protein [Saprospiraceae bacterium]